MFSLSIKALVQAILLGHGKHTELVSSCSLDIEAALKRCHGDEFDDQPNGLRDNLRAFCNALANELDMFYGEPITDLDGNCLDQDARVFSVYVKNEHALIEITVNVTPLPYENNLPPVKITKRINHF